jgi:uncharacterized HAD superfamily protein
MKIGIDLDGVVVDLMTPFLEHYNEKNGTNFEYGNLFAHDLWLPLKIERAAAFKAVYSFMNETGFKLVLPHEGAIEAIKKLNEEHDLVVITSRPELYAEKTIKWLNYHLPEVFEKVVFTHEYTLDGSAKVKKEQICKQEGVDLMIEDYDKNLLSCATVCKKVLLFDQPWNQNVELPNNATRVKSWGDVLKIIGMEEK